MPFHHAVPRLLVASVAVLAASSHAPAQFTFTKVVDSNTINPLTGERFVGFESSPILDNGVPYFAGRNVIWSFENGALVPRVSAAEGGFSILSTPHAGNGTVAFNALTTANVPGVYAKAAGVLTTIADTSTPVPGQPGKTFTGVAARWTDGPNVAFAGQYGSNNAVGIYVNKSGVVSRVADPTVNVPNTGSRFVQFFDQRVTNGVVTFAASGQNNTGGIYRWNDGTITTYLDTSLRMPDGTNHFTGLGTFSEQGSDIAFGGAGADPLSRGIYALVNGSVSLIADVRTRGIGTDRNIEGFSNPALYNGNIVFLDNHDYVLYDKSVDGALRRIIGMGDVLGGKRIDSMDFTRMGRSGDDLIFWFKQNGPEPTYQAIYTVHIAAPGSILLVAGAGVTAVRRRRAGV